MADEHDKTALASIIEFFSSKNPFKSSLDPRKAFEKAKFKLSEPYTFTERRQDLFKFFKGKKSAGLVDYLLLPAYALLLLASVFCVLLIALTLLTDFPLFYIPLGAAAAILFVAIAATYFLVRATSYILSTFLTILSLPILGILHGLDIDYRKELEAVIPERIPEERREPSLYNESNVDKTINPNKAMIDSINKVKSDFNKAIAVASEDDKVFDDELKKDMATIHSLTEKEAQALFIKYQSMQAQLNLAIAEQNTGELQSLSSRIACQALVNRNECVSLTIFVLVIKLIAFDKEKISSLDLAGIESASKTYLSLKAQFSELKQSYHKQDHSNGSLSDERKEKIRGFHELLDTVLLMIESLLGEIKNREETLIREQQGSPERTSSNPVSLGSSNLILLADKEVPQTQSTVTDEYSSNSPFSNVG